mmetsp:Transcript_74171/g.172024  ORF Transcript_74171/g.172024 Transcript_74171/m.172024 type:complete len:164 (+) Transcript_74171:27-518(+)
MCPLGPALGSGMPRRWAAGPSRLAVLVAAAACWQLRIARCNRPLAAALHLQPLQHLIVPGVPHHVPAAAAPEWTGLAEGSSLVLAVPNFAAMGEKKYGFEDYVPTLSLLGGAFVLTGILALVYIFVLDAPGVRVMNEKKSRRSRARRMARRLVERLNAFGQED